MTPPFSVWALVEVILYSVGAITADNGPPWGSNIAGGLSTLEVWLMRLGIEVSHSRPSLRFMQEEIFVYVLVDLLVLKAHFSARSVHATLLMDGTHALQICVDPNDLMRGAWRVNERILLMRIACGFLSLRWFADEHSTFPVNNGQSKKPLTLDSPGVIFEPPPWLGRR